MKNASIILSSLSLIGVLVLFGLYFSNPEKHARQKAGSTLASDSNGSEIAYVDIDSFQEHYSILKNKEDELKKKRELIEAELQQSFQKLQNDANEFQRKAQNGTLSQAEAEAAQKKLMQGEKSLRLREQTLSDDLLEEREKFNEKYEKTLKEFLEEYNKDKGYNYIFSYRSSLPLILLTDKDHNITEDVIKGMNERAKKITDTSSNKK